MTLSKTAQPKYLSGPFLTYLTSFSFCIERHAPTITDARVEDLEATEQSPIVFVYGGSTQASSATSGGKRGSVHVHSLLSCVRGSITNPQHMHEWGDRADSLRERGRERKVKTRQSSVCPGSVVVELILTWRSRGSSSPFLGVSLVVLAVAVVVAHLRVHRLAHCSCRRRIQTCVPREDLPHSQAQVPNQTFVQH